MISALPANVFHHITEELFQEKTYQEPCIVCPDSDLVYQRCSLFKWCGRNIFLLFKDSSGSPTVWNPVAVCRCRQYLFFPASTSFIVSSRDVTVLFADHTIFVCSGVPRSAFIKPVMNKLCGCIKLNLTSWFHFYLFCKFSSCVLLTSINKSYCTSDTIQKISLCSV